MSGKLKKLLNPAAIAIVGVSERREAAGTKVFMNLRTMGYEGPVFQVNPRHTELHGEPCYPSLESLPQPVDAVFLGVPASAGPEVAEQAGKAGARAIFVNANGYADGDEQGVALQRQLEDVAARYDIAISGPNNMGLVNVHDKVAMWTPLYFTKIKPGPVGVISQSGSVALILSEDERDLGLSYIVTAGNEANTTVADYLDEMAGDPRVKVILMYLETIRDPQRFSRAAAKAAAAGKPIIALKLGTSDKGRSLVQAHTGSLAGEESLYDAFFRANSIIRVNDLDEMLETAALLVKYPDPPRNGKAVIVTLSGGEAALIADVSASVGLDLPDLPSAARQAMSPAFPPFAKPGNPLDAWGLGFNAERFRIVLRALVDDPTVSTLAFSVDAPGKGGGDEHFAAEMGRACLEANSDKRMVFFNNTSGSGPNAMVKEVLERSGMPYLSGMRTALVAMRNMLARADAPPARIDPLPAAAASLPEDEPGRFDALRAYGIPMSRSLAVRSACDTVQAAGQLGYPVVLKGVSNHLPHKSDLGLVALGLATPEAVRSEYERIRATLGAHTAADDATARVVVQPMADEGIELIVGVRNDPQLGSFVIVGPGGILVELADKASVRLGPVSPQVAREMLEETVAGKLLAGVRGKGPWDIDAAAQAISRFSQFAAGCLATHCALEINPLIVQKRGALGVDFLAEPHR